MPLSGYDEDRNINSDPEKNDTIRTTVPPAPTEGDESDDGGDANPYGFISLFRRHWVTVVTCCSVFWSFGMCVAFLGPTIRDLGCMTASHMRSMSWVFFAQLMCTLLGSIAAGLLAKRVNHHLIMLIATTIIPMSMFVVPFCKSLTVLALVLAVMGLNMGVIDSLANLRLIQVFQEAVPPFLQTMHACYGLGAFVSPMIAEPFIADEDCTRFVDYANRSLPSISSPNLRLKLKLNDTLHASNSLEEAQSHSRVRFAFWIMGATQLPVPILVLILLLKRRCDDDTVKLHGAVLNTTSSTVTKKKTEYEDIDTKKDKSKAAFWDMPARYKHEDSGRLFGTSTSQIVGMTVFTGIMAFLYDGLQSGYGAYVFYYGIKSIAGMSKTEGAYLNACFWGAFALGRVGSIFLATWFAPAVMLLGNIMGCFISMTTMVALRHDHVALYVGTVFFGTFLSSVTPTSLSLAEQYIDVSPSVTTFIVVVAALGEMAFPVILGNLIASLGPVIFLTFCLGIILLSVIIYTAICFIGRQTPKYKSGLSRSLVWCWKRKRTSSMDELVEPQHVKYYSRMSESDSSIELTNKNN